MLLQNFMQTENKSCDCFKIIDKDKSMHEQQS